MEPITTTELSQAGRDGPHAEALRAYIARGLRKALASHRLSDDDIEDFSQDAIVRVFEKIDTFRGDSRLTTWAMAIAIRLALTALRSRRYRERLHDADTDVAEVATRRLQVWEDPTRPIERRRLYRALRRAIEECLSERQRFAVLAELDGVPTTEIAAQLGINRNALYKLHHDARKKMRAAIHGAGFSADEVRKELLRESEEA
jgi:RNA polymerase sigma-70 factor (ECF subfamily)